MKTPPLKVALVHDFLREYGGAERVVEVLHEMFPDAPLYTAFSDPESMGMHWERFKDWDIRHTWFANIPLHKKLYSPLRFLAPHAFRDLDLSDYDLVISSSNAFMAKAVTVPNGVHVCYCHTPPRSLYGYSTMSGWKRNPLFSFFGTLINHYLRVVDFQVAQKVDHFVANSQEVQQRIKKYYRRDSTVIYPPVNFDKRDLAEKQTSLPKALDGRQLPDSYFFFVSRLGLQKHPELAVQACTMLNLPLVVAGTGNLAEHLHSIAGPSVFFTGAVSDQELAALFQHAQALIYPVEDEDFGIVPVEAMSFGVPVIAHRSGGPKETVIEGKTGVFIDSLTVTELTQALTSLSEIKFTASNIKQHAQHFSKAAFIKNLEKLIAEVSRRQQ